MRRSLAGSLFVAALGASVHAQGCPPPMGGGGGAVPGKAAPPAGPSAPSTPSTPGDVVPAPATPSSPAPGVPAPSSPRGPDAPSGPLTPGGPVAGPAPVPAPHDFPLTPGSPDADALLESVGWRTWWRYNGEAYLDVRSRAMELQRRTGSDAFSIGHGEAATNDHGINERVVQEKVVPALAAAIRDGKDARQVRAAVLALGRVESSWKAADGSGLAELVPTLLASGERDVVEATLVALGLTGTLGAVDDLVEVLRDAPRGRDLFQGKALDARRRAFAAYGLGLAAAVSGEDAIARRVAQAVSGELRSKKSDDYDLHSACVAALGALPLEACKAHTDAEWHVCRTTVLEVLRDYVGDGRRHPNLRAQAALALGRVAARASDEACDQVRELLLDQIGTHSKASVEMQQCATLALGLLGDADQDSLDREIREALARVTAKGDRLSRGLAMVALAKVGARAGRGEEPARGREQVQKVLLNQLERGQDDRRAWAALALGVNGNGMLAAQQAVPADASSALRVALGDARSSEDAAAYCIGLALMRDANSAEALTERFEKSREEGLRSCAALALGWVGASTSGDALAKLFLAGPKQNELFSSAATSLRLLGHPAVVPGMVEMLHVQLSRKQTSEAATCAQLLGRLGDPRAVDALAKVVGDPAGKPEARAAAASSLAELCDRHARHWSLGLSADAHFGLFPATLVSYSGAGTGLFEMR